MLVKRANLSGLVAVVALFALWSAPVSAKASLLCTQSHWVGSWMAAPSDAAVTRAPLSNQTLRMVVTPHLAGDVLRIHLSNRFGATPITLGPVTVGVQKSGPSLLAGSERAVTFGGAATVTIPPGGEVISDRVSLTFGAFENLAVSVDVPGSIQSPTEHAITRQTSYLTPPGTGDHAAGIPGTAFTQVASSSGWYFLDGIDVIAGARTGAVVAFGDSLTDGYQAVDSTEAEQLSTIDTNSRYPDYLQRRLIAAGLPMSVLNAGITGNQLLSGLYSPVYAAGGLVRFSWDALAQAGVTDVIVLEGVNDLSNAEQSTNPEQISTVVQKLIAAYEQLISEAHAAGLKIQLGTLTPLVAVPDINALRLQVNQWIRTQTLSDGIVDFDAAVRDPSDPNQLDPAYDGGDGGHLDPAGYEAMADAVDLNQLATPVCTEPRLHVTVVPAHVRAGKQVAVRVHVTATGRASVSTVMIRVDGQLVYTTRSGQATVRLRFARARRLQVRASRLNYQSATAALIVQPRKS
jgi:lysophospholipase L1-like esterase